MARKKNTYTSGIEYAARILAALEQEAFDRPFDWLQDPSERLAHGMTVSALKVG